MNAARIIPGRPFQSGTTAAHKIVALIEGSLDASPALDPTPVKRELDAAVPYLAQLVNAGHLAEDELVLMAATLRLAVTCPVGARALTATENLLPARGAATATTWRLHLPCPDLYEELLAGMVDRSEHLTTEPAPAVTDGTGAGSHSVVDLGALARTLGEHQ